MLTDDEYVQETQHHIDLVDYRMFAVREALRDRSYAHDQSKLVEPERSGFRQIASFSYGSPAYRAAKEKIAEVIQHHYAHNSHHPEHYPDGVAGMSLLDVIEMVCDWSAASEQRMGKKLSDAGTLQGSFERFGIDPQLAAIILNTVREMEW